MYASQGFEKKKRKFVDKLTDLLIKTDIFRGLRRFLSRLSEQETSAHYKLKPLSRLVKAGV